MRRVPAILSVVLLLAALGGGLWLFDHTRRTAMEGTVETVAEASLQGLREQARLSAFAARFVAVTTSEQIRFGLKARQTMIMPGLVRYEIDLNQIGKDDLAWDEASRTLTVTLPPLILTGPQVDLTAIQVYDGGGILIALTDAEKTLDAVNRRQGQEVLIRQARGDVPMRLAKDATRRAIERSFAMPLRAAGLEATVVARFQ